MTNRRANVYLSANEPRCAPGDCDRKHTCARYLAPLPPTNAAIEDFSRSPVGIPWFRTACEKWVSAEHNKPLQQAPVIRRHRPLGSDA